MTEGIANLADLEPGWVWLTGAGPGDPGLLTLYAWQGLRQADVVVYDALVSPEILDLARPGCVLQYAGKRGGKPSPKQADISERLVRLARQDKRVLRLKGGDPFVFGRGGEEALALVAAGIPFRIVPGVTSGIGGLAYAGIPLTHRDTNASVTFVTGHSAAGAVPETVDWTGVARGSGTLVVFMPLKHLAEIAGRLLAAGRDAGEPAALIVKATTAEQQVLETTLGASAEDAAAAGLEPPALFVLGEVVRLRAGLDWLGALHGRALVADPLNRHRISETG
ncbi:MAG: uroporphyrinogen-III C-methyltransferase [Alphaproteobacteria bacterium]|nr:uroporphyrinogen-III C-methyltransferase [Alphaproteobacteria bacterium]